jgi:hypothetical protein
MPGQKTFRTALLVALSAWAMTAQAQMKVETQDGLGLVLDAHGAVAGLTVDGKAVPLLEAGGGFYVEDVMHSLAATRFEGAAELAGDAIIFRGSAPGLSLELAVIITAHADHISVDGKVTDTTGEDRGLRVGFNLPVDGQGRTWWDDTETPRPIAGDTHFANYGSGWGVGPNRQVSAYPFASMTGGGSGLSLAQRMDQPRFFRLFFESATGYNIDYNLGLSAETTKFPSAASFHFLLYRHDPEWGMRAAAQRYYEIFADFFQVRAERQGVYCYGIHPDLEDPEDFGLTFDLAGFHRADRGKLQEHGIYLLVHPMGTEAHIRWPEGYDWGQGQTRPSLAQMETIMHTPRPELGDNPEWQGLTQRHAHVSFEESRQRVVNSAVHGPDGHFRLFPYSGTIEFVATSADPELPSPNMAGGEREHFIKRHIELAKAAGSEIDGVDFDNIVLSAGRTRENFRREHFRFVDHPLIYDTVSGKVCIQTGISFYEFVKEIADEMHAQGKLCTGNLADGSHAQIIYGHLLDKHGGEVMFHTPTRDLRAGRTLAYQKPVSDIIMPGAVSAGQQETVMHRWLAFGAFPAISELVFSGNSDFEAARPLYRRFMPEMQRIAYAGWEPITHARVAGEGLFVERFGNWADGDLHFTVHNDTDEPQHGRLAIDSKHLGIDGTTAWAELLSEEILDAAGELAVELLPHHTKVFHIFAPDRGTLPWWQGSARLLVKGGGKVLQGDSAIISASVKGSVDGMATSVVPPSGWSAEQVSAGKWRLAPEGGAVAGELEVLAQPAGDPGGATLRRTIHLTAVPAAELASATVELTLHEAFPLSIAVRNNSQQSLQAVVELDLTGKLGGRIVGGQARITAGETAEVVLPSPAPLSAPPGEYDVDVSLNGVVQTFKLRARRGLLARKLMQPPTLDGMLDDWTLPPTLSEFEPFGGEQNISQQTQAWIGYDEDALYLAVHCAEDRMEQLRANVTEPDGPVWEDDDLAIFLDPGASRSLYYQFEINPLGTVYDSHNDDRTWNSGASIQSKLESDAWVLEMAIPWSALGSVPDSGSRWGINLGRQEKPHGETSSITSTFKETAAFADLIFE